MRRAARRAPHGAPLGHRGRGFGGSVTALLRRPAPALLAGGEVRDAADSTARVQVKKLSADLEAKDIAMLSVECSRWTRPPTQPMSN